MTCTKCGRDTREPYFLGQAKIAGIYAVTDHGAVLCTICTGKFQRLVVDFHKKAEKWYTGVQNEV